MRRKPIVNAELKKFGKRVKKTIVKREKNYIYESDSGEDPYTESVRLLYYSSTKRVEC